MFDLLDHQMFDLFAWKKKKAELTKIYSSVWLLATLQRPSWRWDQMGWEINCCQRRGWSCEGDGASAHRPEGGRGNGTVAEDWRHQRKSLSFRAWNKDLTQTLPALFHFNPSTLATSLLTLNCYLWRAVWSFLPVGGTNRGITEGKGSARTFTKILGFGAVVREWCFARRLWASPSWPLGKKCCTFYSPEHEKTHFSCEFKTLLST